MCVCVNQVQSPIIAGDSDPFRRETRYLRSDSAEFKQKHDVVVLIGNPAEPTQKRTIIDVSGDDDDDDEGSGDMKQPQRKRSKSGVFVCVYDETTAERRNITVNCL